MTLMGMQDYLYQTQSKNLNDTWELDSTILTFDKDTLLDTIMLDAATLGINNTDPDQYYRQCAMWWKKWRYTFQTWWKVAETEYHWEWNTEWWEDGTNKETGSGTKDGTNSETQVIDGDTTYGKSGTSKEVMDDDTTGSLSASGSSHTTNEVSAFDAPGNDPYVPHDTSSTSSSNSENTSGTDDRTTDVNWSENGTGTDDKTITTNGTTGEEMSSQKDASHDIYKRGNIGVMSTQQLERETMETKFHYNPYELMAAVFIKEMTCAVW